jgi:hypothetical protein
VDLPRDRRSKVPHGVVAIADRLAEPFSVCRPAQFDPALNLAEQHDALTRGPTRAVMTAKISSESGSRRASRSPPDLRHDRDGTVGVITIQ